MSAPPPPPPLIAPLVALLGVLALAEWASVGAEKAFNETETRRDVRTIGLASLPPGCLYEGRWFSEGGTVPTGEACLHCACFHGALTCRRRACAALPDPPPHRCHVLHRRGSCCPELHCTDGIMLLEHGASARFDNDVDIAAPLSIAHACVEGGTVYAGGSAMRSMVACEQCFCLGGARRCVRPQCLPPPPGCRPRPAPGACCPQRYYCEHRTTKPPEDKHPHDCKVNGKWITEGEKVESQNKLNCTQCFCLRGAVQCQPLACAPPLMGCQPLLRPGECCAHQYHCERPHQGLSKPHPSSNALTSARNDHQASENPLASKRETSTKTTLASIYLVKNTRITSATNNLVSTTKVKRKTSDAPPPDTSKAPSQNVTETTTLTTTEEPTTMAKMITTTETIPTTEITMETTSTEQPDGSVRIMINGTINCTAELSSTSLPLNVTLNDTDKMEKIPMETHPRIPIIDVSNLEDHTFSPNDIITDRNVNGGFEENEIFVINVTSSLITNTTQPITSTKSPNIKPTPIVAKVPLLTDIAEALNTSKKTKGDYDYDYPEPTLPPSLPNLKIIPFLAADAVVETEHSKETLTYPINEREDKFPVYYPSIDDKVSSFTTRRQDSYHSTQYPVFITDKGKQQYPSLTQDVDLTSTVTGYSNVHNDLGSSANEYTVSASLGSRISDSKTSVTQPPATSSTYNFKTPVLNLFSPPVETEGGFVPKGPSGLIDDYYAVFPTTPSGASVPHLTTSMQLDVAKGECRSGDGRHIREGDTVTLACSQCACAWGELHCSPRPCHTPRGCRRRPAAINSADLCCGELTCQEDNKLTPVPEVSTVQQPAIENVADGDSDNKSDELKNTTIINNYNIPIKNNTQITANEPLYKLVNVSETAATSQISSEHAQIFTSSSTTETLIKLTSNLPTTSSTPSSATTGPDRDSQPLEYEEEEEDEGGFSLGNVLKLLLSGDSYETTTVPPKRLQPTTPKLPPVETTMTMPRRTRPTLPPAPKPSVAPFVPMPLHPFNPPKITQSPINRIDHLVLGEATAIKRTTLRPLVTSPRPTTSNRPATRPTIRVTSQRIATKPTEAAEREELATQKSPALEAGLPGMGPGLLKLAGCNIYGQMYRVGRIITELSTPCQECWCTESGVQCKQLKC